MQEFLLVSVVIAWVVIILNLFLTLTIIHRINDNTSTNQQNIIFKSLSILPLGDEAPQFTAQTLDGKEVTNSNYLGKISVLTVVSNTCVPCHDFINSLDQEIQFEIEKLGLNFILIGTDTIESMKEFVAATHTSFPSIVAPKESNPFANDYKIPGTPVSYILDQENRIKWIGHPAPNTISQLLLEWTN